MIPTRPLGKTGLHVSILGFGASPLGGVFRSIDEEECRASVHQAFHAGVNFFDTSPFYGLTKSETVLGVALKGLPRSQVIISTKVGRYGQAEFDFSASRVTSSVTESLRRLQMEYIDLIQCHDIEFGDLDQIINETLPALHTLKAKGLVRFIGITGLPLSAFHYVLDRVPKGTVDVVLSYCHNSLNDQSLIQELLYFEEKGVGVINASPLSMGLLTKEGPPTWHPAPIILKDLAIKAASLAESRGMDIAKIALAHSLKLSNAGISSTLIGMSTREEVTKNVSCCLEALGLVTSEGALDQDTTREIAEMFKVARDNPLKYSW